MIRCRCSEDKKPLVRNANEITAIKHHRNKNVSQLLKYYERLTLSTHGVIRCSRKEIVPNKNRFEFYRKCRNRQK